MNDDPETYLKYCAMQKSCAITIIDDYIQFLKWHKNSKILDVGSGDGTVSLDILFPKLPKDLRSFILSDVSDKMVKFMKTRIEDPRIEALQLDISTKDFPKEFYEHFDHVFSFHCLNCIAETNQLQSFKNMYDMLKPRGEILLCLIVNSPVYDIFESISRNDKWEPYSYDYIISPYYRAQNPSEKLMGYLESVGFLVQECKDEKHYYTFSDLDYFVGFILSILPFMKKIPENKHADFISDLKEVIQRSSMLSFETRKNGKETIKTFLRVLIVHGSKPI